MLKETGLREPDTPLMIQYQGIKAKYPDALLLFRIGDFYETFGEDAIKVSNILGIVLTRKTTGSGGTTELAGFPYHSLDNYLPKLVRAGHRVAICDQLEDPKYAKKLVKRGITELVTPGVSYNDKTLEHESNNFLAGIYISKDSHTGMAFLDVSTGEFLVANGDLDYAKKLFQSFQPSEVLYSKDMKKEFYELFGDKYYCYSLDGWIFSEQYGRETLLNHFETLSLKGYGIEDMSEGVIAAGVVLHYLKETQHEKVKHINKIARVEKEHYVWLDEFTIRNLELIQPLHGKGKSLLDIMDKTSSPMGLRLMRRWLSFPLTDKTLIDERLDMISWFLSHESFMDKMEKQIRNIGDLERLIAKVAIARINPREVVQLKHALLSVENIKLDCFATGDEGFIKISEQLNPCKSLYTTIDNRITPEPPVLVAKGNVIAKGVDNELDELRNLVTSGKNYLLKIQQQEIEQTGINSLKIGYNNIFGYYLEVTNSHKNKVPVSWIRKQTLTNAERYVTEELKLYEEKIVGAEVKIINLEEKLFTDLVLNIAGFISTIQQNAALIARIDCILSFAKISREYNYVKPQINGGYTLNIQQGRHPVIEQMLPTGESYVSNDVILDDSTQQIIVITGPNMSGKSALLRQTALIVIMAQAGCFVPALHAEIGIVDKIFTRVGASDNISSGESTFMVEMNETASILNNLTPKSFILLDEIGRGTSTYDGISIAWAIAEFLHENETARAKTLFATHYHELNEMANRYKRVKNFHVSVKESGNKVIFMRKLLPGGSEHSFGIHVAKMAGIPVKIVHRALQVMKELENLHSPSLPINKNNDSVNHINPQLSFFQLNDPILEEIREEIQKTDIDSLSPIDALLKLNAIKNHLIGK